MTSSEPCQIASKRFKAGKLLPLIIRSVEGALTERSTCVSEWKLVRIRGLLTEKLGALLEFKSPARVFSELLLRPCQPGQLIKFIWKVRTLIYDLPLCLALGTPHHRKHLSGQIASNFDQTPYFHHQICSSLLPIPQVSSDTHESYSF